MSFNRPHTQETKDKIRKRLIEIGYKPKVPLGGWNKGKKWSQEVKDKISAGRRANPLKGKNHPDFRGYKPVRRAIWCSQELANWRIAILKRDNKTCVLCGATAKEKKLEVDHIKPRCVILQEHNIKTFEQALECSELWDISNGRTLCVDCHKQTDTYKSKAKKLLK